MGRAEVTRTPNFFPAHEQVQQQDAGAERMDHYPGLNGKGLCARALYDYQAGTHCSWLLPARGPGQEPAGGSLQLSEEKTEG